MGYRSNISLVMKRELLNELISSAQEKKIDLMNIMSLADISKIEDEILFVWNDIKWYGCPEIEYIKQYLHSNDDEDIGYSFYMIELGEDYDDNQFHGNMSDNLFNLQMVRDFSYNIGDKVLQLL